MKPSERARRKRQSEQADGILHTRDKFGRIERKPDTLQQMIDRASDTTPRHIIRLGYDNSTYPYQDRIIYGFQYEERW